MITIVAKNRVSEDKMEAFKALAQELINETRKEPGCIKYCLYEDSSKANILTFIEEWESKESIDSHFASAHFTRILPQMKGMLEGAAEINLYKNLNL